MRRLSLLTAPLILAVGCRGENVPTDELGGSETETTAISTDTDTETETDSETESETDTDTETGTDTDEPAECGDGIHDDPEECDDGNSTPNDGCTNDCTLPICGDAIIQAGEACDDGNAIDDDACTNACVLTTCGNGALDPGEECEDGDFDPNDGCTNACLFAFCGDGITWSGYEECDDANAEDTDACTTSCNLAACGDPFLQPGEECEDGNAVANDGCFECLDQQVEQLSLGWASCALLDGGQVRCWGWGSDGTLGYGNLNNIGDDELPSSVGYVDVGEPVVQLEVGSHVCALLNRGLVKCWGNGGPGGLGYANTVVVGDDELPADVGLVNVGGPVVQLGVGYQNTCAVLDGGAVRCWGYGRYGQNGYGNEQNIGDDEVPATAGDLDIGGPVAHVTLGNEHACALLEVGTVRCWGSGTDGKLGHPGTGHIGDGEDPIAVYGDVNIGGLVVQIDAGAQHTCVLLDTGAVRCWGKRSDALGYGLSEDIGDDEHPADVGDVDVGGTVTSIAVGSLHSCALLDTGVVRCWGSNLGGQLGYPNTAADEPGPDVNVGGVVDQLLAGSGTTCAILDSGAVRCWGYGTTGNLGYGNIQNIGDDEHPVVAGNVPIF